MTTHTNSPSLGVESTQTDGSPMTSRTYQPTDPVSLYNKMRPFLAADAWQKRLKEQRLRWKPNLGNPKFERRPTFEEFCVFYGLDAREGLR